MVRHWAASSRDGSGHLILYHLSRNGHAGHQRVLQDRARV